MFISQINKINKNVSSKRFDDFIYLDYPRNVLLLFLKREKENLREITESRRSARWRIGIAHADGETARLSDATMLYYLSVVYKLYDLMMDVMIHFKLLLL